MSLKQGPKFLGIVLGWWALIMVGLAVVGMVGFGVRWVTAGPVGQLEAREQILSGANRIAQYDRFFAECASIQSQEAQIDALNTQLLLLEAGSKDYNRTVASIAGVTAQRDRIINDYNSLARREYTSGQFRDSDLPFQIPVGPYEEGTRTSCFAG